MTNAVEYICEVGQGGKFPAKTRQSIMESLCKMQGKRVKVRIEPFTRKRSSHQNAFYFGVVVPIVRGIFTDAGNVVTAEETHEYIKAHIWKHVRSAVLPDGEIVEIVDSSTKLSTMEWEDAMEKTRAWCAEYGAEVPFPNEF